MNISELTDQYNTNENKISKKKTSIERLTKQITKMEEKNSWVDVILKPIAKEISSIISLPVWDILGPFGLDNITSIHFAKDKESYKNTALRKSITFVPQHEDVTTFKLYVKDYTINTGTFEKGTMGHTNDMNYPNVDITDLSIEELIKKWVA